MSGGGVHSEAQQSTKSKDRTKTQVYSIRFTRSAEKRPAYFCVQDTSYNLTSLTAAHKFRK